MFAEIAVTMDHIEHRCLDEGSKILQDEAKRVLGTYDYGWPRLKPQTIKHKGTGDSPLLETGDLRDSIERDVQHGVAYVGRTTTRRSGMNWARAAFRRDRSLPGPRQRSTVRSGSGSASTSTPC